MLPIMRMVRAAPGPAYPSLHHFISAVTCPCRTYMQAGAVKCDCKETTTPAFHVRLCKGPQETAAVRVCPNQSAELPCEARNNVLVLTQTPLGYLGMSITACLHAHMRAA